MSHPPTVPAGPLYIAAVLEREGYRVDFRDFSVKSYWDLDPLSFCSYLENCNSVIGLSCMSDSLPFVICALRELKRRHPRKTVVLGGAGPSGMAKKILNNFPFVDIVVVGEGERTIVEVMECLTRGEKNDLKLVNGICYRDGEEVWLTPPRERIQNLDELPFPLYERIPMEKYPLVNIVFSRGCPYRCTFCDVAPIWGRANYRRSVDSVVAELRFLKEKYGKVDFEFTDETFVLNRDDIFDFCERFKRERMGIRWACTGRINLMSQELLAEMASSGCKAIFYGVESGSDMVLEKVKKDFSAQEAVEVIHTTLDYTGAVASFIWGFPFESKEDLLKTLLLMVYLSQIGVDARLNRLTPFALAPLYKEYGDHLIWFEEAYSFSGADPFHASGYRSEIGNFIREFPSVFPEFRWFPTDLLREKSRLVESLDRHWPKVDWPVSCESFADVLETHGSKPMLREDTSTC